MPYPVSPPPPPAIVDVQETNVLEISVQDFNAQDFSIQNFNAQETGNSDPATQAIEESSTLPTSHVSAEANHVPSTVSRSASDLINGSVDGSITEPVIDLVLPEPAPSGATVLEVEVESPSTVDADSGNAGSGNAGSGNAARENHEDPAETIEITEAVHRAGSVSSTSPVNSRGIELGGNANSSSLPLWVELPPIAPVFGPISASTIPATQVPELTYDWNHEWVFIAQLPGGLPPIPEGERPVPEGEIPPLPPLPPVPVPPAGEILIIPGQESPEVEEAPDAVPDGQLPPVQPATQNIIELTADRQEYDEVRQVFLAEGNVELRFQGAVLLSDRLQVNIPNRIAVADGDAALIRGAQVLRGERITYNLTLDQGSVQQARGELFLPELARIQPPRVCPPILVPIEM
ncbi:hypothetical protein [Egbenema bharatensis]|uniref:hypothetical protein n=1 Tax=Egbenema bharatensis TaxID=3463334 RepID=UPI003A8534B1